MFIYYGFLRRSRFPSYLIDYAPYVVVMISMLFSCATEFGNRLITQILHTQSLFTLKLKTPSVIGSSLLDVPALDKHVLSLISTRSSVAMSSSPLEQATQSNPIQDIPVLPITPWPCYSPVLYTCQLSPSDQASKMGKYYW